MKTAALYVCEKCGTEFRSKVIAEFCESSDTPPAPVAIGDAIEVATRNEGWQPDTVKGLELRPSIYAVYSTEYVDGDPQAAHVAQLRKLPHEWVIITEHEHYMSGKDYYDRINANAIRKAADKAA